MIVLFLFLIEGSNNMKIEEINIEDEKIKELQLLEVERQQIMERK